MNLRTSEVLRWVGLAGIATVATARALIVFAPQRHFDVDPAVDPLPLFGLGPGGSLLLDVLLLLACACALGGEALARRGLDGRLLLLVLLPAPIVLYHGWDDLGDLWRGSTWLGAAVACAAAAHLARDRIMRIALIAVLLGALGPLLARGFAQVTFEHAATVAFFEEHRERILHERGWEPGSPSALIYERRLKQPQPLGWFATTNIYASLMVVGVTAAIGLAIGAARARIGGGWIGVFALIAIAAGAAIALSGSKGAMIAAIIGTVICAAPLLIAPVRAIVQRWGPPILLCLIAAALLGIAVRGTVLPEGFLGEKSLLFRWHYITASAEIIREQPLVGTGPDGFQLAYMRHRPPRSPEEVASAHSVLIEWLSMLGILGAAWAWLALMLLWRAGAALRAHGELTMDAMRPAVRVAVIVMLFGVLPAIWIELEMLDALHAAVRLIGAAGFVAVAGIAAFIAARSDGPVLGWTLAAAATALLVHGQIEMTFTQPGAAVWVMTFIGAAGAASRGVPAATTPATRRSLHWAIVAMLLALATWLSITGTLPALRQEAIIAQAAATLHPPADIAAQRIAQREQAVNLLLESHDALATNPRPLHAAARQLELAAMEAPPPQRLQLIERASAIAEDAAVRHQHLAALGLSVALNVRLAHETGAANDWERAIDLARRVTEIDPHGIAPWRQLGDVLWLAGRHHEAAEAYEQSLANDANFELDPLKQLPQAQREQLRRRIAEVRSGE